MSENPSNIYAAIVCEDARYPMLCITGKFNYGLFVNPETGDIEPGRKCICEARSDEDCFCNL